MPDNTSLNILWNKVRSQNGWLNKNIDKIKKSALINTTLQGAYLILAARSVGLDCGSIVSFDNKILDDTFYPEDKNKSIFICGFGVWQ